MIRLRVWSWSARSSTVAAETMLFGFLTLPAGLEAEDVVALVEEHHREHFGELVHIDQVDVWTDREASYRE